MATRRQFLTQTATAGLLGAGAIGPAQGQTAKTARRKPAVRIQEVIRREDTVLRFGGHGAEWHMSWAADDRQFVSLGGGTGWSNDPRRFYTSRLFAVSNGPRDATFHDVPGYPDLMQPLLGAKDGPPGYVNFGTLALDGHVYQFLNTFNKGSNPRDTYFIGTKLIYSPDNGRTWRNQDGSTPVVWESWEERSRDNMLFFEEPQNAFSLISVLQMGRNYAANRDGYVYLYAPNGNTEGTMNQLVICRAPKAQLLNRGAYEFFAGVGAKGHAKWARDINERAVAYTFPSGWVNKTVAHAWQPSVVYNVPLGLYMMANWGNGISEEDGEGFVKPCYIGFWVAPNPWGPWTQVHEDTTWTPGNDPASRAYMPIIAPKWISADGKSFWIVWSDLQQKGEKAERDRLWQEARQKSPEEQVELMRRLMPYYSFNAQRVDLVIA